MSSITIQHKILNTFLSFVLTSSAFITIQSQPAAAQNNIACNCVLYARTLAPSLPRGLFTLQDKIRIINSYQPSQGAVAIIDSGLQWGHVAVVTGVNSNGTISIQESNWTRCRIGSRSGTPQALRVVGYYQP